jgi:hypothetical protein
MTALPSPALAIYLGLSLLGVLLIFCTQLLHGLTDTGSLLLVIGLATLVVRFYWMPYAYLAAVCFFQLRMGPFHGISLLRPSDMIFCGGTLLYLVATLRVHALTRYLGPYDARLKTTAQSLPHTLPSNPRSAHAVVPPQEYAWLVVMTPIAVMFALLLGRYLQSSFQNPAVTLIWLLVVGILLTRSLLDFWQRSQMDPETAQLYLQEVLWQESRAEQHRLADRLSRRRWFSSGRVGGWIWTALKIVATLAVLRQLTDL